MKKIIFLAFYVLSTHSMDVIKKIDPTEEIILNTLHEQITFHSTFPTEINRKICRYTCLESSAENLNDVGKIMSILVQTNKTLKKLFNKSENCLFIIKKLSTQFDCSNEKIAQTLQIKEARNRLYLQKTFLSYCKRFEHHYDDNSILQSRFARLKRDNVDFNFTYGNEHHTGLMAALCPVNPEPATAQYLILNGADLYLEDKNGFSAHSRIFSHHPYIIPFLVEHKKLEPNKKNGSLAQTPLINLMLHLTCFNHSEQDIQSIENGMKILIEAGADPELEDKNNRSPLSLAPKQNRYPQFVTLLEDAIKKKHATQ